MKTGKLKNISSIQKKEKGLLLQKKFINKDKYNEIWKFHNENSIKKDGEFKINSIDDLLNEEKYIRNLFNMRGYYPLELDYMVNSDFCIGKVFEINTTFKDLIIFELTPHDNNNHKIYRIFNKNKNLDFIGYFETSGRSNKLLNVKIPENESGLAINEVITSFLITKYPKFKYLQYEDKKFSK